MYIVQIMPDQAYVDSLSSKSLPPDPLPIVGQWYTIASCTLLEDAKRQQQMLQQMFAGYTFQLIEQGAQ